MWAAHLPLSNLVSFNDLQVGESLDRSLRGRIVYRTVTLIRPNQ
jgi:hypothetical protein